MLYITWTDREKKYHEHTWHVGSPLPAITGRVVRFEADGDELAALVRGLDKDHQHPIPGERIFSER